MIRHFFARRFKLPMIFLTKHLKQTFVSRFSQEINEDQRVLVTNEIAYSIKNTLFDLASFVEWYRSAVFPRIGTDCLRRSDSFRTSIEFLRWRSPVGKWTQLDLNTFEHAFVWQSLTVRQTTTTLQWLLTVERGNHNMTPSVYNT